LQFSHHLANEKRREGYDNVEVRAHVMASLNGRKPQLLIDPTIDLAKERISALPTHWIMPLTEPLPAGRRPAKKLQGPRTDTFPSTDY
jgi:vitamin K-dependent gamma-carboxylase